MPEYGRHVQKMIDYVISIPDKDKRNEQIRAVLNTMGILNPQLRDINDFRHKLWDHVQIISDFKIDIDSPYPIPTKETFDTRPNPIPLQRNALKEAHYGRNIQNMIEMIAEKEEGEVKYNMIKILAGYMRQQYLIWNKDTVTETVIFNDIVRLSDGRIVIPEGLHLNTLPSDAHFQQPRNAINNAGSNPVSQAGNNGGHRNYRNNNLIKKKKRK